MRKAAHHLRMSDELRAELDALSMPPRRVRRLRFSRRRRAEHHTNRWVKVPQWMVNDPDTPCEAFRVFCYFACIDGWCHRNVVEISADLRMTPIKVKKALKFLRERKLIECGPARKYHATARRATPYGMDRWCPVPVDAVTSLTARSLRVLAMLGQARLRRVPDPTVDEMVAVCAFWGGKPCRPSTVRTALRELRKGGWMDHLASPVAPRQPAVMMDPIDPDPQEEPVYEQPELISVDTIRDIVEGPLTPENDPDRFQEFWRAYPRRTAKGDARKAWAKALKNGADAGLVIGAAKAFAIRSRHTEARYIPYPATWLNREQWDDEPDPTPVPRSTTDDRVDMAMEAGRRFIEKYGNVDFTELERRRRRGEIEGF